MMNHHLPAMPHGQPPPRPPPRRQHDSSYPTGPPNMRSSAAYMAYPPHLSGHPPPPYTTQQYPHWYPPYPQMQAPPRHYQPPYAPLVVSSYPQSPPVIPSGHIPLSLPQQPRTSTPLQPPLSPPVPAATSRMESYQLVSASATLSGAPSPTVSMASSGKTKLAVGLHEPFRPPLPWLSVPENPFPSRVAHRRRRCRSLLSSSLAVELPVKETLRNDTTSSVQSQSAVVTSQASSISQSEPQTPTMSVLPSDAESTQPTTPLSATPKSFAQALQHQPQENAQKSALHSGPAVPVVPVIPVVPQVPSTPRQPAKDTSKLSKETPNSPTATTPAAHPNGVSAVAGPEAAPDNLNQPVSPPRATPKTWADLVRSKAPSRVADLSGTEESGLGMSKNQSLSEVVGSLGEDVSQYGDKVSFVEPRGLVNTGNMCYMNSVLQILLFCVPFYQFLEHLSRRASHSFYSDLPLIDAMIMFMREFRVIDAAQSEEKLKLRLKPNELEQYGEAFTPEFVYEVIRQLPRFRDMRRGHQQDAQEFLGFLLEEMHEECARATKVSPPTKAEESQNGDQSSTEGQSGDGWLEVGHKQKSAVTRSSGNITSDSPITKIFGGKVRSEFKVPGNKNSVTLEPYQPLQLDIGSSDIHNIVDALKGLTRPETIHGDFNSSRGSSLTATKQMFIETLPPVLILHLKRFQYDQITQGTQKIWKKVGYPLDLEIPREVFSPHRRNAIIAQGGLPKYRLIGVIYHHGKNASGGHYTVDVRRQDGREWIRLDDTVIRRIRSEDVAEAGSEEDPKVLAAALEQHKRNNIPNANIFDHIDPDDLDHSDGERGWSQVNGSGTASHASKKSMSNGVSTAVVASGPSSGVRTPIGRYGTRDNKVAYLLFYQRIA